MIFRLSTKDEVHRYNKSIVILFKGKRKVLSTSPSNGGYREDLEAVFNNDGNPGAGMASELRAPTYEEHMQLIASELGLNPDTTAGISTAASMDNVSIKSEQYEDLTVTAIVTGGVEINGGRVGDPAYYHEHNEKVEMIKLGTINIILVIDGNLPEDTITRALVTCTEAKTAVLQELMAGSNYSTGIATGSGTDGTIIISNAQSDLILKNAGKHSKLGELIGLTVKSALKEALYLQSGLCAHSQHSILGRMKRYGIDEESIWSVYSKKEQDSSMKKANMIDRLHRIDGNNEYVTYTSLYAHLLDQMDWELISPEECSIAGDKIIELMKEQTIDTNVFNEDNSFAENTEEDAKEPISKISKEDIQKELLGKYINTICELVGGNCSV